jgi:general secretion pathway protein H
MKRRVARALARRAGFTMLESLVALALVAMAAGMGAQLLRPPSCRLKLETAARTLCATLRATRSRAIATNSEAAVVVDVYARTFVSPVGKPGVLPAEAVVTLDVAPSQQVPGRGGAVTFFPDGASTGADITVRLPDARAVIGVNWLTGATTCSFV